jgi:polygalacturonase
MTKLRGSRFFVHALFAVWPVACGGKDAATTAGAGAGASSGSTTSASPGSAGGNTPEAGVDDDASSSGQAESSTPGMTDAGGSSGDAQLPAEAAAPSEAGATTGCGAGDPNLPPEPVIPPACVTLAATQAVASGTLPSETSLDTAMIQTALAACGAGHAVKLATSGANNALVTGPLTLPSGVSLWVDAGVTLYASRTPSAYGSTCGTTSAGSCTALITSTAANTGIFGDGIIDGQGGEPIVGQTQSWWDLTGSTSGASANPALIQALGATNFTLYRITLHNSPKFHVKLNAKGFVVWGITVKTPSTPTNSQGTALTPAGAHNTDGVDPGESASNGYIVCNTISDGDDQIAIKGGTSVNGLTIAHNHFGSGHGMSIGSETNGGVSNVNVYDLSIDGTNTGLTGGSSNGIRIKSDPTVGGPVKNVTYSDVCVRNLTNPILVTPHYSSATGTSIPSFTGIVIRNFRSVSSSVTPNVTLDGYDASNPTGITLDNVVIDDIAASNVTASYASVTLGPGNVNFTPSGTGVTVTNSFSGTSQPNACTGKWVTL